MNRETPFNPEEANFSEENNAEQKAQIKELTEQEKTDLAFKKTVNEFKDIAKENPITKGIKKILGK